MILPSRWTILIVPVFLCLLFSGCAEETTTSPSDAPTEQSRNQKQSADQTAANKLADPRIEEMRGSLVGIWLGQAYLDADKVQQKLASFDGDARTEFESIVQDFMTTIMAIEFHENGTMDTEIELTFDSQHQELEASHGTWQVIETQQNRITIATVEQIPDGSAIESQQSFEFYEDRNVMATNVPVQNELSDLGPRLIFRREILTPETDTAATNEQTNASAAGGRLR